MSPSEVKRACIRAKDIIRWDLEHRVARLFWDWGVRGDTLSGRCTFVAEACKHLPSPIVTNAYDIIRQWERNGGPPPGIPVN